MLLLNIAVDGRGAQGGSLTLLTKLLLRAAVVAGLRMMMRRRRMTDDAVDVIVVIKDTGIGIAQRNQLTTFLRGNDKGLLSGLRNRRRQMLLVSLRRKLGIGRVLITVEHLLLLRRHLRRGRIETRRMRRIRRIHLGRLHRRRLGS